MPVKGHRKKIRHLEIAACRVTTGAVAGLSPLSDTHSGLRHQPLDPMGSFGVAHERRSDVLLGLAVLEDRGFDPVPLEQLVELRAVATRELRGLGHAAMRELEDAREIVALE